MAKMKKWLRRLFESNNRLSQQIWLTFFVLGEIFVIALVISRLFMK